jgi:hypothetical protein
MKLSDLFLNRWLYKSSQDTATPDSSAASATSGPTPTSFISYGGNSAIDVNTNTTTIDGGKIRTGIVESTGYTYASGNFSTAGTQINLDNGVIRAPQFGIDSSGNAYFKGDISGASGTFSGAITIGSGNNVFKVQTGVGMWLGNTAFASAPFRVDMAGNATANSLIITGYIPTGGAAADVNANATTISGGKITTGSIQALQIGANQVTADKLTAGTFNVGGTSEPTAIVIAQSTISGNARLGYVGGSRIWEDSSSRLGYNAIGGTHYFYTASNEAVVIPNGAQTWFNYGISCRDSFNVGIPNSTVVNARITGTFYFDTTGTTGSSSPWIYGTAGTYLNLNGPTHILGFINGSQRLAVSNTGTTIGGTNGLYISGANKIDFKDWTLTLTSNKTAIVPTSEGFNALYCIESPEVWFMDFCEGIKQVDPLFVEVTVPPYHFIKCEDGGYQVWGKRKGHDQIRFEEKTREEFEANEKFLKMSRPINN